MFVKINKMLFSMLYSLIILSCGGAEGGSGNSGGNSYEDEYLFPAPLSNLTSRADVISLVTGSFYYVDVINGDDSSGAGSTALP